MVLLEQHVPALEGDLGADLEQYQQLVVGRALEEPDSAERIELHHIVARYRWTRYTDIAPSPTAEATRFMESSRTSPAAKTPGTLVSSVNGDRAWFHAVGERASRSCPVMTNPLASRTTSLPSQSVRGEAPMKTNSQLVE